MTEQQVQNMINKALTDFKGQNLSFRSRRPTGSVQDKNSPVTGASQKIGFFGTPKISQPTVTGSKGGNAALTSLCTALANLGLIINSTS